MKHKLRRYGAGLVITLGLASGAMAADYSAYTNEEMMQIRSQARDMSPEDRDAFRSEMQSRHQSLSAEERNQLREQNRNSGQGNYGQGNRYGQGNSGGQGNRYGQGGGGGGGQGHRYGQGGGGGGGGRGR